jgi:hypothetical protein
VPSNDLYSTNIYATYRLAEHIREADIDARLEGRDTSLVNDLGFGQIRGMTRRRYSFASKYCHWHQPDAYPIYDRFVDRLLWAYQRRDRFASFRREDLKDYPRFVGVLQTFCAAYGLTNIPLRRLDKFLWLYGKDLYATKGSNASDGS